jgi:hypothetical protein
MNELTNKINDFAVEFDTNLIDAIELLDEIRAKLNEEVMNLFARLNKVLENDTH